MDPPEGGDVVVVVGGKFGVSVKTPTIPLVPEGEHVVLPHVNGPPPPPLHPVALKSAPLHTRSMSALTHVPALVLS
jgi:hypothetical protein